MENICEELDRVHQEGAIELINSEWVSPVVVVSRMDGKLRFFVDYRNLNIVTEKDSYIIHRMDEYIDSSGRVKSLLRWTVTTGTEKYPLRLVIERRRP